MHRHTLKKSITEMTKAEQLQLIRTVRLRRKEDLWVDPDKREKKNAKRVQ